MALEQLTDNVRLSELGIQDAIHHTHHVGIGVVPGRERTRARENRKNACQQGERPGTDSLEYGHGDMLTASAQ